jgi:hypothetical protein
MKKKALKLYKKYVQLEEEGEFEGFLERIYEDGKTVNYRPPASS